MGGWDYIPKVGKVYVVSLTTSFVQVLTPTQTRAIRGFKVKSRLVFNASGGLTSTPGPFDIAFNSAPSAGTDADGNGFYSNSGAGSGDTFGPSNGLWARSAVAGTLLEIMILE